MDISIISSLLFLQVLLFGTAFALDLARRNEQLVWIYGIQSIGVALLLMLLGWSEHSWVLFTIVGMTILIKVLVVPGVLLRLIKKHQMTFTAPAYLNTPVMFGVTLLLVVAVYSTFAPIISRVAPGEGGLFYLSISSFFVSLFLAINRKGAFSQIIGILSAENAIVVCAALMKIHTELWLELGILADVFAWLLIGSTFVAVVSKHFGTTDVSTMKELAE
jgi:hydrogenase-4 membrane subunit HyfE